MNIKLLIIDVDGILTDGMKFYMYGKPAGKQLHDRDFTAIKLLEAKEIHVCFLTADSANEIIAADRGIVCFWARDPNGKINKGTVTENIMNHYKVTKEETASLGDDIFDVAMFRKCAVNFCPANAAAYVRNHAQYLLHEQDRPWIWHIVEQYILENITDDDVEKVMEIDKNERWGHNTRESNFR